MSNILNLYSTDKNQFEPFEPTDEIVDSWETIIQNINNGTYSTKYRKGQYKPIDLGDEGIINMQIVAFDADDLADDSGKVALSFVALVLLNTTKRFNPARAGTSGDYTEGTGTIGGYAASEMKDYLDTTVFALLPAELQAAIKSVKKYSRGYSTTGTASNNMLTFEKLFIPSHYELFGDDTYETQGVSYASQFPDVDSLKRKKASGEANNYALRTAGTSQNLRYLNTAATETQTATSNRFGICIGFCL